MYPVNSEVEIPDSYKKVSPLPSKTLKTEGEKTEKLIEELMELLSE